MKKLSILFLSIILVGASNLAMSQVQFALGLKGGLNLSKVDLYMPNMGHGSEPPKVTTHDVPQELSQFSKKTNGFGCYLVDSMQLFMPGKWQVRAFYKNGDEGIFNLEVQ